MFQITRDMSRLAMLRSSTLRKKRYQREAPNLEGEDD